MMPWESPIKSNRVTPQSTATREAHVDAPNNSASQSQVTSTAPARRAASQNDRSASAETGSRLALMPWESPVVKGTNARAAQSQTPIARSQQTAPVNQKPVTIVNTPRAMRSSPQGDVRLASAEQPVELRQSMDNDPAAARRTPVLPTGYLPRSVPSGAYNGAPSFDPHNHGAAHAGSGCGCSACSGGGGGPFRFSDCAPSADQVQCPWSPPGIERPWPHDEYIWDGGDRGGDARVKKDRRVVGLDQEDTVAHYDTLDGRTLVTESNRVPIYAPRFASVRKVIGVQIGEQAESAGKIEKLVEPVRQDRVSVADAMHKNVQPVGNRLLDQPIQHLERRQGFSVENEQSPRAAILRQLPFEDLSLLQRGIFDQKELPRLAERIAAAEIWVVKEAVQVVLDGEPAHEVQDEKTPGVTVAYDLLGKPRLRIIKIADRSEANPGEVVRFSLRFDNIGDQTLNNVVVLDNLTTRLEYVPDTQKCSLKSEFSTEPNDGGSDALRWAIQEPLKVNEGGLIRFHCKVK